jgi:PST family polysaccharide transporter
MTEIVEAATVAPPGERSAWRFLVRSFRALVLGEGLARVFGLAAVVLLGRRLGPVGFGAFAVGSAFVSRLGILSDSGTEMLTVRDVAREPERFRELTEKILGLRLVLSLAIGVLYVAGVLILVGPSTQRTVYLLFVATLPAMALNMRWMALGVQAERAVAVGNVVARMVFLGAVVLFATAPASVTRVPWIVTAQELAYGLVLLVAVAPRHGVFVPRVDLRYWAVTLRQSVPLMVSALARGLSALDVVIIAALLGAKQAGIYSAGTRPMLFVVTLLSLFYVSFLASYASTSGPAAAGLFRRATRASFAVSLPAALALSVAAATLVPLVFGGDFRKAGPVLAILAWKLPFSAMSAPYNGLLLSEGHQALLMRNNVVGAVVNVVGDVIALLLFGLLGAAAVSVVAGATTFALNYRSARSVGLAPPLRSFFAGAPA